ncbi:MULTISPECIES: HNH endonuclease [unclassified Rhodococcus (in: high G+C Gram-positive bacteria)]|uniref:HNH endonuclease n=1 Tax=unclassified Rhodococcus (in: high G+C Gram-positive bacteria) TaxID=192944 RepID=UPI00200A6030|nr:HNH endonuclease [Rhodococcus sp. HM1]MCK8671462.1 HNH endonuclease [Rhodococcus sp. HM1]
MSLEKASTAWLAQSKQADYRRIVGSAKYDDNAASHYSWDSSVVHHDEVQPGDIIAIWDEFLIGVSVIEHIEVGDGIKTTTTCPVCNRANVVRRKRKRPPYRCDDCHEEFDEPIFGEKEVTTYRSSHAQAWIDLEGVLDGKALRSLCVHPKEQNSFRRLRLDDFREALEDATDGNLLHILDETSKQMTGGPEGHVVRPVRVRVGQAGFRAKLLAEYGAQCAVTGAAPKSVLEACHLYSYAEVGKHADQGGLLLRRDIHRLFDQGLIAVDESGAVDVAEEIRTYPTYGDLHGKVLQVVLTPKQRKWIRSHWLEWRGR